MDVVADVLLPPEPAVVLPVVLLDPPAPAVPPVVELVPLLVLLLPPHPTAAATMASETQVDSRKRKVMSHSFTRRT